MNLLYYNKPTSIVSGPLNVAWHLSRALSKKMDITYFPSVNSRKWIFDILNVYTRYLSGQFDVIHFNLVPTWINGSYVMLNSAVSRKIPTVLNIHGFVNVEHAFEPRVRSMSNLTWVNCFNSCKIADRVVVNSDFMKRQLASSYRIAPNRINVIPNGVDVERFAKCKSRITLDGDPAILSVGQVCMLKGFGTFVDALGRLGHELPNMKLHLVGQVEKEYIELAESKGVSNFLVFHGRVPHSLIPTYLKSADFSIFGSVLYEGFGIVLVEAMASGLPVIASDIDTYSQIITDGKDGLLFKRGNADSLSEVILNLTKDVDLRRKISQNSQITAEKYDWEKIAESYISLYRELCYGED